MIDVKWAKENSNVNLVRIRQVAEAKERLEKRADERIKDACERGQKYCAVDCTHDVAELEALDLIMEQYSEAGYEVETGASVNGQPFVYVVKW